MNKNENIELRNMYVNKIRKQIQKVKRNTQLLNEFNKTMIGGNNWSDKITTISSTISSNTLSNTNKVTEIVNVDGIEDYAKTKITQLIGVIDALKGNVGNAEIARLKEDLRKAIEELETTKTDITKKLIEIESALDEMILSHIGLQKSLLTKSINKVKTLCDVTNLSKLDDITKAIGEGVKAKAIVDGITVSETEATTAKDTANTAITKKHEQISAKAGEIISTLQEITAVLELVNTDNNSIKTIQLLNAQIEKFNITVDTTAPGINVKTIQDWNFYMDISIEFTKVVLSNPTLESLRDPIKNALGL